MTENAKLAEQIRNFIVKPDSIAIWGLGQMGLCIKDADQQTLLIDPILSNVVAETFPNMATFFARTFDPPLLPEEIDFADIILCTHEHLDHADPLTLAGILYASPQAVCYTSAWAIESLQLAGLDVNRMKVASLGNFLKRKSLSIFCMPSAHYEVELDPEKGSRWLGFILDWGWLRLYHSGDTIVYPDLLDTLTPFTPIRLMMLPVNGRDAQREALGIVGNLHQQEAQNLAAACRTETIFVGHNDLFAGNSVPLTDQTADGIIHKPKFLELRPGQLMVYRKA
jgi:L-ascorbate metabolism protein UlaG (beta-lactamase superfamily)